MDFTIIVAVILFLYLRTKDSYKLIDDPVPRSGYLREMPRKVHFSFYDEKKPIFNTVVNIGTFIATTAYVYHLWGFKAALLYAVLPTNVSGVAWTTGNYYMTTVLFTLTAYWLLQFNTALTVIAAMLFYYAALHSTISAIPFAFYMAYLGNWWMMPVLVAFLCGDRFINGIKLRKKDHDARGQKGGEIDLTNFYVVAKTIAYYIVINIYPARLGFFHNYGKDEHDRGLLNKASMMFWLSVGLIGTFAYVGWQYDPKMVIWFILFIGIFSQFTTLGQFIAERYMYLANVAFCVLAAKFLSAEWAFAAAVSLYTYRSLLYIPVWRHNKTLFNDGVINFPQAAENYNNLALFYLERGEWRQAIYPLLCAVEKTNGYKGSLYLNLTTAYIKSQQYDKALYYNELSLKECTANNSMFLRDQRRMLEQKVKRTRRIQKQLQEA